MRLLVSPSRCGYALALWLGLLSQFACAQTADEQLPVPEGQSPENPISVPGDVITVEPLREPTGESLPLSTEEFPGSVLTESDIASLKPAFPFGYNLREGQDTWLPGGQNQLGIVSLECFPSLPQHKTWNIDTGIGIHFLNGPILTDMPPRLFDFQIRYQNRKWLSDTFGYDLAASVGVFSDFEGSAREGVRFPAHAVGYYRWLPNCDFVFGVEYLNRDDVQILPVAGLIITPREDLRLELVFPRPRAEVRIDETSSLYVAGELGGGTWAIERTTDLDDVVTYHDLRLFFGLARRDAEGNEQSLELGYVFDRELTYRSGNGNITLGDALMIRLTQRY